MYDSIVDEEPKSLDPTDWNDINGQTNKNYEPTESITKRDVKYFPPEGLSGVLGVPLTRIHLCPESGLPYIEGDINGRIPELNPFYGANTVVVRDTRTKRIVMTRRNKIIGFRLQDIINCKDITEEICIKYNDLCAALDDH